MIYCSSQWGGKKVKDGEHLSWNRLLLIKLQISPYYHGHRVEPLLSLASANKFAQLNHLSPSKDSDSLKAFTSLDLFPLGSGGNCPPPPRYIWEIFNSERSVLTNNKGSLVLIFKWAWQQESGSGGKKTLSCVSTQLKWQWKESVNRMRVSTLFCYRQPTYLYFSRWPAHPTLSGVAPRCHFDCRAPSQWAHSVIHCGFNVARLPFFSLLFENLVFNETVLGRPVGLNTEWYTVYLQEELTMLIAYFVVTQNSSLCVFWFL